MVEIDAVDLEQGEIALAFLRRADLPLDRVAGAQAEAAHLARADIDIVRPREVIRLGRSEKAETVLQNFEHAVAEDRRVVHGELFQDREHHVLAAQVARVFDLQLLGIGEKLGRAFLLEFLEIHGATVAGAGGSQRVRNRLGRGVSAVPSDRVTPSKACRVPLRLEKSGLERALATDCGSLKH